MSVYSSISQAVLHLLPKWLSPDVDDTPEDKICPDRHQWPVPGPHPGQGGGGKMVKGGWCGHGRRAFPPPPTPLELTLAHVKLGKRT